MFKRTSLLATIAAVAALTAAPAEAATPKLTATVGPNDTISLRTAAGAPVRVLKPGRYTIVVRDRADDHNFILRGPGVTKSSGVGSTGTATWRVTLRAGAYRFWCGPHADEMKGSFRVR
jgi:plastocyanin